MKRGKIVLGCLAVASVITSFIGIWLVWHESYGVYHIIAIPYTIVVIISMYLYDWEDKRRGES